ncbi:phage holin family protein [Vaginella massiliensis]|uniref:phage holin family protein n=1 Tax=Vaginella massiliensis TaxID=1816680 RepID=UPI0008399E13|nr:phage holin family protein [Vaginella massiliensis]
MSFILNLIISAIVVFVLANILPGVSVSGFGSALILALVLGLLNSIVKPILKIISLPVTIITLGLFSFVITALIILLADKIMGSSFEVTNFWYAMLFGVVLGIVQSVFGGLLNE